MNKFEGITVVHLESSDYVGKALKVAVAREIDTSDIVIDGDKVVKNRVNEMGLQQDAGALKTFNGLSLTPVDALSNIAAMIEVGLLLTVTDSECKSDGGDYVLTIAKQYAEAACKHALEEKK